MSDADAARPTESTPDREARRRGAAGGNPVEFARTTSFLVARPLAPGSAEAVRDRVDESRPDGESETARLVPGDDVVTASLFLAERDGRPDALVWYLEVERGDGAWTDPVAALGRRTPLYDGAEELFTGSARLYGDPERMVHASNRSRPDRPEAPDVVLIALDIRPGVGTWLARSVAGLIDALRGTRIERELRAASGEVIEDERMWTETLFLAETDGEYAILWYMEADDIDRVMEVYETTDNRVARWSEVAFDHLLGTPLAALGDPAGASEYELLVHETNAARR